MASGRKDKTMKNFTVGPVEMFERTCDIAHQQVPYFRTSEFSQLMLENEAWLLELFDAPDQTRIAFITGSGTSAMETSLANVLNRCDRALIVDGGGFGHRFVEIAKHYGIDHDVIKVEQGATLTQDQLRKIDGEQFSAFVVNLNETSTGTLYDLELIHQFCAQYNLLLIVDAVSAFLSDPISMKQAEIDVLFTGSQKALALAPGMAFMALSTRALKRIEENKSDPSWVIPYYLDIMDMLESGVRGQTPYTPAVSVLLQLHDRLRMIREAGGAQSEIDRVHRLATYFRDRVYRLGFTPFSSAMGHGVTSLIDPQQQAMQLFNEIKDTYRMWICPNGGALAQTVFRVGHLGNLCEEDYDRLLDALQKLRQ